VVTVWVETSANFIYGFLTGGPLTADSPQRYIIYTRAFCKGRGLTLLLRVGALWRFGDNLFFEVLPLVSDALLTTLHLLLENVLQTVDHFKIS
jgi:hypothetical protein